MRGRCDLDVHRGSEQLVCTTTYSPLVEDKSSLEILRNRAPVVVPAFARPAQLQARLGHVVLAVATRPGRHFKGRPTRRRADAAAESTLQRCFDEPISVGPDVSIQT